MSSAARAYDGHRTGDDGDGSGTSAASIVRRLQLPVECLQLVQAPMVVISDLPFRLMVARWGATLTYTQMLPATRLLSDEAFLDETLLDLRAIGPPASRPLIVAQLAGDDADLIVRAARLIEGLVDAVELNLGCPQQRAKDEHYGGYLLNKADLLLVCSIISALASSIPLPIFAKIRLPPAPLSLSELACSLAAAGASVITLHARPVGSAQRRRSIKGLRVEAVQEMRRALDDAGWGDVRVVGNGGVRSLEDAVRLREEMGVDGWMVGEELASNPRFFTSAASGASPLELIEEYLDLVRLQHPSTPISSIQRHLRNWTENDLVISRSPLYKRWISDVDACTTLEALGAVAAGEEVARAWAR